MEAGADSVALDPVNGAAGGAHAPHRAGRRRRRRRGAGRRRRPGGRAAAAGFQRGAARGRGLGAALAGAVRPDPRVGDDSGSCRAGTSRPTRAPIVVRLDPGLAFGTGSHASTRLVLQALEKTMQDRRPRAGLRLRLGYIGHRRRQARRRGGCRGGHRSAGARYDNRECAHQRRKPARRAAGTAARGNLRHGPGQHPCRSADRARSAARGAHAQRRPHPALGNPAIPGRRGGRGLRARLRHLGERDRGRLGAGGGAARR